MEVNGELTKTSLEKKEQCNSFQRTLKSQGVLGTPSVHHRVNIYFCKCHSIDSVTKNQFASFPTI